MLSSTSHAVASPVVIVVDDDEDTRLNLSDILELDGMRVEVAGTVRELFGRQRWDEVALVLLDRKLPDGSPEVVVPELRESAPHTAVIIVTGYADIEGAIQALRCGAVDYILKPVNPDALLASVQRVLRRQRDAQEIARLNNVLARSEEQYRALFENTLDGLIILDDEDRVVAINPAACARFCSAARPLRGQHLSSFQVSHGGQVRPALRQDFFARGGNVGECQLLRDDGLAIDVEYRAVADFAPGLHLISLHDVTARKQAEERARQSQRLAAIGETMAALVHESRNALQRSKACLEMLTLDLEDRPEALHLVARAQRAQEDLHRLYEEVRQWAAPVNLRREPCNLRELWNEVWIHVNQAQPAAAVPLEERLACDPSACVDRFLLGQVFRNIFENALEVSPAGAPVSLSCSAIYGGQGEEVVITISDQGPGLSAEQQQRIFEPFFTTKAKGTGLGMAIASRIVQAHGGSVTASSPRGAMIEIRLPKR
jgi:two-component system sensor kinase FixL